MESGKALTTFQMELTNFYRGQDTSKLIFLIPNTTFLIFLKGNNQTNQDFEKHYVIFCQNNRVPSVPESGIF